MKYIFKFFFIAISVSWLLCGCQTAESKIQEQLNLGEKYMTELDYENAILTFNKVIEMEPREVRAYAGKAQAYAAQKEFVKAKETLQEGFSILDQLTAEEKTEEMVALELAMLEDVSDYLRNIVKIIIDEGKYDEAVAYAEELLKYKPDEYKYLLELAMKYKESGQIDKAIGLLEALVQKYHQEDIEEVLELLKIQKEIELKYGENIDKLKQLLDANDQELGAEALLSEDFLILTENLEEPIILKKDDDTYIGVYPNGYVYIGEMKNEVREGYGTWYRNTAERYSLYRGDWKDDYPNGRGYQEYNVYHPTGNTNPFSSNEGGYKDGYQHGNTVKRTINQRGESYIFHYTCENGMPHIIAMKEENSKTPYIIAYEQTEGKNHSFSYDGTSLFGVDGARKAQ